MTFKTFFALVLTLPLAALSGCADTESLDEENMDSQDNAATAVAPITLYSANATVVAPMRRFTVSGHTMIETSVADPTGKTSGSATFTFNVAEAGTYDVDAMVQAFKPSYNELFFQFDGEAQAAQTFDPTNALKQYRIGTRAFTAGSHKLIVRGKAQFTRLESVKLTFKAPPEKPNFSTKNGLIYDPEGHVFQPRGVDVDDVSIALADVDKITTTWSANIIRLCPYNAKDGVPVYDEALLAQAVSAYTKKHIVVELGDGLRQRWGDTMSGQELKDHAAYYSRMANQFKDNPYVWFASPNEQGSNNVAPGSAEEQVWLNEEKTIAQAIRDTGNKNILVQGDVNWGQGAASGGQSAFMRHTETFRAYGNVVAGLHVYNNLPNAYSVLSSAISALKAKGFAVVVDEFGDMNGPTMVAKAGADAVFSATNNLGIGAVAFRWYDVGVHGLTSGGRGNGTLTPWGQKVWAMTHAD